jgi:hypothetical protein
MKEGSAGRQKKEIRNKDLATKTRVPSVASDLTGSEGSEVK